MRRIGVDVGGTFTDLIYIDDEAGMVIVHKTPVDARGSFHRNRPGHQRAVRHGRHRARAARPGLPRHDRRDEHRDRAQRRQGRDDHDQGLPRHPAHRAAQEADELLALAEPAVAGAADRAAALPAHGRRAHRQGRRRSSIPLDDDEVRAQVRRLKAEQVEAVSVCLLFSFLNPVHEQRVAAIVREEFPEAFISVSSEVIPQYREYERFSTVGLNAYVGPQGLELHRPLRRCAARDERQVGHPPDDLGRRRRDARGRHGQAGQPAHVGPDRGRRGRHLDGPAVGRENVITLDVGGTSADIGLAQEASCA